MTKKKEQLKLKDPLFDTKASLNDNVVRSPVSGDKMMLSEVNNIPVWVHMGDRTCLPVKEDEKII